MPLLRHDAIAIQQSHQTALSEQAVVDLLILNIKLHPEQKDRGSKKKYCLVRIKIKNVLSIFQNIPGGPASPRTLDNIKPRPEQRGRGPL